MTLEEQILQEIQSKAITHAPDIAKAASKIALERIKEEVEKAWRYGCIVGETRKELTYDQELSDYLKENGLL